MQPAPDEYARAIESHLCLKNDGHLIRIVGPAFDRVVSWAEQGIPLKVALAGVDRYFERYYRKGPRRRPVRVEFCDADVLDAFDEWRRAVGVSLVAAEEGGGPAVEEPVPASSRPRRSLRAHIESVLARLKLLKMLALSGCIVTIDAIGTQTNIAKTIVEAEAEYVFSVKENQGHLYEDISVLFGVDQAQNFKYASLEYAQTTNKDHGRIEVRECWSTANPQYLDLLRGRQDWIGLKSMAMVVSTRIIEGKETRKVPYYISSLPSDADRLLSIVRKHWSIENELHWVLDVAVNEDHSRVRKDQAPENFAVLRHIALNLLKQEDSSQSPPGIKAIADLTALS